jgi:hypothetical protein
MHHVSGENIAQFLLPKICPIIGSLVPAVDWVDEVVDDGLVVGKRTFWMLGFLELMV